MVLQMDIPLLYAWLRFDQSECYICPLCGKLNFLAISNLWPPPNMLNSWSFLPVRLMDQFFHCSGPPGKNNCSVGVTMASPFWIPQVYWPYTDS